MLDAVGGVEVVEVEAFVEGFVDLTTATVRSLFVETDGILQETETVTESFCTDFEFGSGVDEAVLDTEAFHLDGVASLSNLVTR